MVFSACREDLPVRYYALRGDFLFFLLGFKPACLIGHGKKDVEKRTLTRFSRTCGAPRCRPSRMLVTCDLK